MLHAEVAPKKTPIVEQEIVSAETGRAVEFVTVGDAGNVADENTHLGSVMTPYQIGKYEITVEQWCELLNAVAYKEDPHGLYNPFMNQDGLVASIYRIKNDGDNTYLYLPLLDTDLFPITYVSYNNALRFCNWYEHGKPTRLLGDNVVAASTEDGAYTFKQLATGEVVVTLSANAHYFLPSEDQWIKAAYYAGGGTHAPYWLYPTQHDTPPNTHPEDSSNRVNIHSYSNVATTPEQLVLKPVNYFDETQGAYGTRDMGGNVMEWMTRYDDSDPSRLIPITRGGSWASESSDDLRLTAPAQSYDSLALAGGSNKIGFRIVTSLLETEKASLSLASQRNHSSLVSDHFAYQSNGDQDTWQRYTSVQAPWYQRWFPTTSIFVAAWGTIGKEIYDSFYKLCQHQTWLSFFKQLLYCSWISFKTVLFNIFEIFGLPVALAFDINYDIACMLCHMLVSIVQLF